jgi:hypothetical protein
LDCAVEIESVWDRRHEEASRSGSSPLIEDRGRGEGAKPRRLDVPRDTALQLNVCKTAEAKCAARANGL